LLKRINMKIKYLILLLPISSYALQAPKPMGVAAVEAAGKAVEKNMPAAADALKNAGAEAAKEAAKGVASVATGAVVGAAIMATGQVASTVINRVADHYTPENESKRAENKHKDEIRQAERVFEECLSRHTTCERNGRSVPKHCEEEACGFAIVAGAAKAREKVDDFTSYAPAEDKPTKSNSWWRW
jgi:uncharacterized protein HemX